MIRGAGLAGEGAAERVVEVDRAGITANRGLMFNQPARQLNLVVRF
jgi:hypothetical protein